MVKKCLLVGIGGSFGTIIRYFIGWILPTSLFPLSTLSINILGSFLLGFITVFVGRNKLSSQVLLLFGTGFCGGFTTLSTFASETFHLLESSPLLAYYYVLLSSFLGISAAYLGMRIGNHKRGTIH